MRSTKQQIFNIFFFVSFRRCDCVLSKLLAKERESQTTWTIKIAYSFVLFFRDFILFCWLLLLLLTSASVTVSTTNNFERFIWNIYATHFINLPIQCKNCHFRLDYSLFLLLALSSSAYCFVKRFVVIWQRFSVLGTVILTI